MGKGRGEEERERRGRGGEGREKKRRGKERTGKGGKIPRERFKKSEGTPLWSGASQYFRRTHRSSGSTNDK